MLACKILLHFLLYRSISIRDCPTIVRHFEEINLFVYLFPMPPPVTCSLLQNDPSYSFQERFGLISKALDEQEVEEALAEDTDRSPVDAPVLMLAALILPVLH